MSVSLCSAFISKGSQTLMECFNRLLNTADFDQIHNTVPLGSPSTRHVESIYLLGVLVMIT